MPSSSSLSKEDTVMSNGVGFTFIAVGGVPLADNSTHDFLRSEIVKGVNGESSIFDYPGIRQVTDCFWTPSDKAEEEM